MTWSKHERREFGIPDGLTADALHIGGTSEEGAVLTLKANGTWSGDPTKAVEMIRADERERWAKEKAAMERMVEASHALREVRAEAIRQRKPVDSTPSDSTIWWEDIEKLKDEWFAALDAIKGGEDD